MACDKTDGFVLKKCRVKLPITVHCPSWGHLQLCVTKLVGSWHHFLHLAVLRLHWKTKNQGTHSTSFCAFFFIFLFFMTWINPSFFLNYCPPLQLATPSWFRWPGFFTKYSIDTVSFFLRLCNSLMVHCSFSSIIQNGWACEKSLNPSVKGWFLLVLGLLFFGCCFFFFWGGGVAFIGSEY